MGKNITAVKCNSLEQYHQVQRKAFAQNFGWRCNTKHNLENFWEVGSPFLFLYDDDRDITWGSSAENTTIITAQEYLGGKDVKQFSVGDRVECTNTGDVANFCKIFTVASIEEDSLGLEELPGGCIYAVRFFRLTDKQTKPKTTKENNMELNSSIRTVLVEENGATFETVEKFQKVFGGEIAQNFTGEMLLRENIKLYEGEIKRLDDIEAKRLKEEAKGAK